MVAQETIGRFARWGLARGPAWGAVAGALSGIPPAQALSLSMSHVELVVLGAIVGLILGPALAVGVGALCLAAERVPRWLLDAPDYVAVVAVVGMVSAVAWPLFQTLGAGTALSLLGIALIAAAPTIDAARTAPGLLHPRAPAPRPH